MLLTNVLFHEIGKEPLYLECIDITDLIGLQDNRVYQNIDIKKSMNYKIEYLHLKCFQVQHQKILDISNIQV